LRKKSGDKKINLFFSSRGNWNGSMVDRLRKG
jgi:hypothetical protein